MRRSKAKLKIHTYIYMVMVFVLLLLTFLAFTEVETVLSVVAVLNGEQNELKIAEKYQEQYTEVIQTSSDMTDSKTVDIVVLGNSDESMTCMIVNELTNLREDYILVETEEHAEIANFDDAEIYMITTSEITLNTVVLLEELATQGKTIVFIDMLDSELLENTEVQELLGITEYGGETEFTGYRVSESLGLNTSNVQEDTVFTGELVEITSTAKTYVYALEDDEAISNEALTPLMWRCMNGESKIYVCNSEVFESQLAHSVLLQVVSEQEEVYIYPVVNAYVLMVEGMPFAEDYTTEFLQEVYNRSAINVQNYVFFPEFQTMEERYLTNITWYSPDYEALLNTTNKELQYYLEEIEIEHSEIGKVEDEILISDSGFDNYAIEWSSEFTFVNTEEEVLNLPIVLEVGDFTEELINTTSMVKAVGLLTMCIDIDDFMNEGDDYQDWTTFMSECNTVLNYQAEEYWWLDRLVASEATERVISYLAINPEYEYTDNKMTVTIGEYNEDAYFHIITDKTISKVENGSVSKIGSGIYLLKADDEHVEIFFED